MTSRAIISAVWLMILTTISFYAAAQNYSAASFEQMFASCLAGSFDEKKCDKAKKALEEYLNALSDECKDAATLEEKMAYLDTLLPLWNTWGSFLDDEKQLGWDSMCGALMEDDNTWVQLYTDDIVPPKDSDLSLSLKVGDEVEVYARVFTSICKTKNGEQICGEEFELPYSGSWAWASTDNDVVEPKETSSPTGRFKAKGKGAAVLAVDLPEFPEPFFLDAYADVTVGQGIADVVFVIENHFDNSYWLGNGGFGYVGLRQKGQQIYTEGLKKYLDRENSRTAIMTYNNPLVYPYNTYYWFDNDAECIYWFGDGYTISNPDITDYLPFTSLPWEEEIVAAWGSLENFCGESADPNYLRTSVYSALMHAMDGVSLGPWRTSDPNVKKVIILISRLAPAGPFYPLDYRVNNPEIITGLTEDDVIARAKSQDISIHVLNVGPTRYLVEGCSGYSPPDCPGNNYFEGDRGTFSRFANETGGTYQETEYPGPSEYAGPNLYLGIINILKQLVEDE